MIGGASPPPARFDEDAQVVDYAVLADVLVESCAGTRSAASGASSRATAPAANHSAQLAIKFGRLCSAVSATGSSSLRAPAPGTSYRGPSCS